MLVRGCVGWGDRLRLGGVGGVPEMAAAGC